MNKPLVSIITVTFNASKFLEETMLSVFSQTYSKIEYIVVDGGSTDGTVELIKNYELRIKKYISEPDGGIYDAMNKGIRLCHGELIGMINASDYYESDAVKNVVDAYYQDPEAGIFHGNVNMLNSDGSFFKMKKTDTDISQLYRGMSLFHPSFFVKRSIYEQYGSYDTSFSIAADFDFALRCQLAGVKFYHIDRIICSFRKGGISAQQEIRGKEEVCQSLLKNGFSKETIHEVFKEQEHLRLKNQRYEQIYFILKKILPDRLLNMLSKKVAVKK
jgi:glycosyltransferase involved in cell wall biosynthesis